MIEIREIAYSLLEISNIDRKETYHLSRIHVFISTIRQLGISSQCLSNSLFFLISFNSWFITHFSTFISSNIWLHINANLWFKNVKSIHHWHSGNAISCNLAPPKTQNFFPWFGSSGRRYIYTILTEVNNQMFANLTLQEAKLSKSCPL